MIRAKKNLTLASAGSAGKNGRNYLRRTGKRGIIQFRFEHEGVAYLRSTGTCEAELARDRAWAIYEDVTGRNKGREVVPLLRNTFATVGAVVDRYRAGIVARAGLAPKTASKNAGHLAMVVREALGLEGEAWREVRLDALTEELVVQWRAQRYAAKGLALAKGATDLWLNGTLNSTLTQARSVFSRRAWKLYEGLKLPAREGLLWARRMEEPDYRFVAIPAAVDAKMKELGAAALDGRDGRDGLNGPGAAVAMVYELARFCGLTAKEIIFARWEWLGEVPSTEGKGQSAGVRLSVRATPATGTTAAFTTKWNSKDRQIMVGTQRATRWRESVLTVGRSTVDYIVPGETATARRNFVERDCVRWVRSFLPDRTKALHVLRAQAGSDVLSATGNIKAAADFLGDRVATVEKYYLSRVTAPAL